MYERRMFGWARDLFPLARSLTGPGVHETLSYLHDINPEFYFHAFKSGESVFDWAIPKEWKIRDAYIEHETGRRFCEFKKNNLHLVGYSIPFEGTMDREDLLPHIYTQQDQPDVIPYITSYYKERWGFCMAHNDKDTLPPGRYRVLVDSDLFDGELTLADARIKGTTDREIVFSSYICHPSMANNELSGPVLVSALLCYVKDRFPSPRFSYRFILAPETIGSLAYLSRNLGEMKRVSALGFVLSCVGDDRAFSHVESRYADNLADRALRSALLGRDNVKTYSFLSRGSDERQYCAPGIDLPFCGFCRTKYGEYPEYHTSADDFSVVTESGLGGSFDVMRSIIDACEAGLFPILRVPGEPQLGKRGLYPALSQKGSYDAVKTRMDFLAYSDGANSLFDIASRLGVPLDAITSEAKILAEHGVVEMHDDSTQMQA